MLKIEKLQMYKIYISRKSLSKSSFLDCKVFLYWTFFSIQAKISPTYIETLTETNFGLFNIFFIMSTKLYKHINYSFFLLENTNLLYIFHNVNISQVCLACIQTNLNFIYYVKCIFKHPVQNICIWFSNFLSKDQIKVDFIIIVLSSYKFVNV